MIELGWKSKFSKKLVQIGDTDKFLTPILNFFEFAHTFCVDTDKIFHLNVKCVKENNQAVIARTTNLNKLLKTHDLLDEWFKQYESYEQPNFNCYRRYES